MLAEEIGASLDCPAGAVWFDGRNDVVPFDLDGHLDLGRLRVSEDVYVEAGRSRRGGDLRRLLDDLCDPARLERALSVFAGQRGPLRRRMTVRVIARLRAERNFQRRELRDQLTNAVLRLRPNWRPADPAALELWVLDAGRDTFVMGLRLSTAAMRHRAGDRVAELPGALRPTVAAAMVRLAGPPHPSLPLLDPCCGSGTILAEAEAAGWRTVGVDIDPQTLAAAALNAPGAGLLQGDARRLSLGSRTAGAVAVNLPFGQQHGVQGPVQSWRQAVIAEIGRVALEGSTVVVLTEPGGGPTQDWRRGSQIRWTRTIPIQLLGTPATITVGSTAAAASRS